MAYYSVLGLKKGLMMSWVVIHIFKACIIIKQCDLIKKLFGFIWPL